ncbi:MAG: hypothetical protein ACPID4_05095 [Parvibaculales bacterium]
MRKIISIAAALMLSACSTNYGMYKKGDEEHGQYGYVSTYLAIAAAAIIISSAGGGGGGGSSGSSGSGSSNSGGSY